MSARITRSVAAAVAASALLGSAALAFPAAANAATPAKAPKPAVTITATATAPGAHLQPGGAARTEIVKVTNSTGKAAKFQGQLLANVGGAVFLLPGELNANVTALGRTPATASTFVNESPDYVGGFYPRGHKWGSFTIPAHTTFAWKVAIAATKSFPLNDNALYVHAGIMGPGATAPDFATVGYKVGSGHTGGPVVETMTGHTAISRENWGYVRLTVTNHTGAALKQPWEILPWIHAAPGARLAIDEYVGKGAKAHWQPLTHDLNAEGLANGATTSFRLRIRLVDYTANTAAVLDQLRVINWNGDVTPSPTQWLWVHRG